MTAPTRLSEVDGIDEPVLNKKILNSLKLTLTVWFEVSASGAL